MKKLILIFILLLTACASHTVATPTASLSIPESTATSTLTPTPSANVLWISPAVPDELLTTAKSWGIPIVNDPASASIKFNVASSIFNVAPSAVTVTGQHSTWIYALVAPFPTVTDGVTSDDLKAAWHGSSSGLFAGRPLWMADSTLAAFTALWGAPADGAVTTAPADQLVDDMWKNLPAWGIVPFESLDPKWKVLTVDGQSPIHKDFDATKYPLQITFALQDNQQSALSLPTSNYDASKLTTIIMTGTTSLVNAIAYQMEVKGIDYPAQDIG
ncbi:MAG: hypothetical protein WBW94_13715, partial [Anaerolineales bacterium]